jgi:predicted transcriptional regulator
MIDGVEDQVDMIGRHLNVLQIVVENEPIGIASMSDELNHAHHEIRYSLRALQEENLINPTQQGAVTTDRTIPFTEELDEQIDEIKTKLYARKIES